jgi:hypothetical protein
MPATTHAVSPHCYSVQEVLPEAIMLDVHAPEHGISGVRDFFMHLLTITVGLFIALSLENAAEALHHRHQRQEAETLIRQEITSNLAKLNNGAADVLAERAHMVAVLQVLEARSQSQPGTLKESDFGFQESPIQDAAWRTAASTGALSYMDYSEVERFSDAYKEQDLLQSMEEKALEDYLELSPIISHHGAGGIVSPETAKDALPLVRRIVAHLDGMLAVGQGTIGTYNEALKH